MAIELADLQEMLGRDRTGAVAPPVPVEILLDRDIDPDPRAYGRAQGIDRRALDRAISRASHWLLEQQNPGGD